MKILYIGAGFVGTCSAAVAADSGHQVLVYDVDTYKIEKIGTFDRDNIETCLFEKGLGDLLVRNRERIAFTADYEKVIPYLDLVDAIFLCLPTPEIGETGESNLSYYTQALGTLIPCLKARLGGAQSNHIVLINKSTVPIEMIDTTQQVLAEAGVHNIGVVSNPEFLVEGKAIEGSLKPDRIVVGAWEQKDFDVMRSLYRRFFDAPDVQYIEVNPKEAAAGKLLANFILFNKLALCFDVVGRVSELFPNIQYEQLRKILTSDARIGSWGLYDSLYAGGSCFIKDARSLSFQLRTQGAEPALVDQVYLSNKKQLERFLNRIMDATEHRMSGKIVALLGTAFKRDTNDVRNSPSIDITRFLVAQGVKKILVHDPVATDNFMAVFAHEPEVLSHLEIVSHEFDAAKQADVVIISTDWPQFRGLADVLMAEAVHRPIIADGRRMLQHRYADLLSAGFRVVAVGSPDNNV
jgi:UDPglucose 6-dehydrogenase